MHPRPRLSLTFLALSAAIVSCAPEPEGPGAVTPTVPVGGTAPRPAAPGSAPDFSLKSTDGRTVRLSDHLGKVVLIDFWSTTCDPCMAEMPHLVDLYKAKKDKSLADVNRVVHDQGMIFPVLLDQETTVVARYNPKREMPFSVLIDRNGIIVQRKPGYTPGDELTLIAEVNKLVP